MTTANDAFTSITDGVTSALSLIPGLAAKGAGLVESLIDIVDKAVSAIGDGATAVRAKLEDLEAYLKSVGKE